jgi:UDP-glucose 4-epimerase
LKALVTGGAGFIGSHLVNELINRGYHVNVLDNLSSGKKQNLNESNKDNFDLFIGDCRSSTSLKEALRDVNVVFHFAANPEVRLELVQPKDIYEQNIMATYILLEHVKKSNVECIVFASSSTIYGEAKIIPTPENYGPLKPISIYGASKLACESLVSSYCYSFQKKGIIVRPANIVGPRATHGVILDFIKKLKTNPTELEILGDGKQVKSYLYVKDCIDAIIKTYEVSENKVSIYNIGSESQTKVIEIAKIVSEEMNLEKVKFNFICNVDGGRGWIGDVKKMLLDVSKLKSIGWKQKLNSKEAVSQATRDLINTFNNHY